MPALAELNAADRSAFAAALGHLFEHSPWVAEETWPRRPFADADALHAALCATMRTAPRERQLALIRSHPDLAGRLARQNRLTAESTREQASAGLDQLSDAELATFTARNDDYRAMLSGELNSQMAFLTGKLTFEGSLPLLMQIGALAS